MNLQNFKAVRESGCLKLRASKENFWALKRLLLSQGWKVEAGEGHTLFLYNEEEERIELSWED